MGFTERERAMNENDRRDLVALLTGELDERRAAGLGRRLEREPDLAAAYRSLLATWNGLGEKIERREGMPPNLVPRVMSAVRRVEADRRAWSLRSSPLWVRTAAAMALALGVGMGALIGNTANLGSSGETSSRAASTVAAQAQVAVVDTSVSTLAEDYWQALLEDNGSGSQASESGKRSR